MTDRLSVYLLAALLAAAVIELPALRLWVALTLLVAFPALLSDHDNGGDD